MIFRNIKPFYRSINTVTNLRCESQIRSEEYLLLQLKERTELVTEEAAKSADNLYKFRGSDRRITVVYCEQPAGLNITMSNRNSDDKLTHLRSALRSEKFGNTCSLLKVKSRQQNCANQSTPCS